MSEPCCSGPSCAVTSPEQQSSECPASGSAGMPVDWTTVAALSCGRVPTRQEFRLCRDPDCQVVYYGSAGTVLAVEDVTVQPGFKDGSDGLICYCFLHHERDLAGQIGSVGRADVFETIKAEVEAGNCACEVRNPAGKCCLGDVQAAIRRAQEEQEATA